MECTNTPENDPSKDTACGGDQEQSSQPPAIELDNRGKMFAAMWDQTYETFQRDKAAARERCLELIQYAYLPRTIRCKACHMLAFYSPPSDVDYWLDLGLEVIEEMETIIQNETTVVLRERNALLRQHAEEEKKRRGIPTKQDTEASVATSPSTLKSNKGSDVETDNGGERAGDEGVIGQE